ncbi:MAG: sulfatase-like hydrolase/transferase [Bacteroidota bacterium]
MKKVCIVFAALFVFSSSDINAQKRKASYRNESLGLTQKPNIIFILADDLGIGNVSCYGADNYSTPNIDKLAKEGILFNHMFTAPLCGPSRALIMTGRYAFRTGATNQDATTLMKQETEKMIPQLLTPAGYVSTCVGKWGQLPLGPGDFGFDDYLRFKASGVYRNSPEKINHYTVNGEDKVMADAEYMPDLMHVHLVDFLSKNKNKPFFAYYPMSHVHGTIVSTPDSKPDSKDLYADNVLYMDKLVGELLSVLDSLHLRENTLIFFMGDNGTAGQYYTNSTIKGKILSGKKGEMKECGGLVPMIANWPGKVPAGVVSNQLIDASDILPTIAELSGAQIPKNITLDGKSFAFNLFGKKAQERDWIFCELGNKWYVRNQGWKLNNNNELFDMSNAPFEEILITDQNKTPASEEGYNKLKTVLDNLGPQNGILDTGDGSGRHGNKKDKKAKSKEKEEDSN